MTVFLSFGHDGLRYRFQLYHIVMHDIRRISPKTTGKQLVRVSHLAISYISIIIDLFHIGVL